MKITLKDGSVKEYAENYFLTSGNNPILFYVVHITYREA